MPRASRGGSRGLVVSQSDGEHGKPADPRRSARVPIDAQVTIRRHGHNAYNARVFNLSECGCKVEIVDRPEFGDDVLLRLPGLEPIRAIVLWVKGSAAGLEFERPIHPAVFDVLAQKLL